MKDVEDIDIVTAEEVEGVSETERRFFEGMMTDMEEQQGQLPQQATVRFALDAMEDRYTIDDVVEISGVPKRTCRRVIEQEYYRENIKKVDNAATGGRFKPVFETVD